MIPDPAESVPPDCQDGTDLNPAGDLCELPLGSHTFMVQAIDLQGNIDLTPAVITWTIVEGSAPETTIDSGPGASTTSTSASFAFSSSESGSTFDCSLDGAPFEPCVSPAEYTGLSLATHQFRVRAMDADGIRDETPASYTWTVGAPDTAAPETTIDLGPDFLTNHTDALFRFSSEAGATFACSLDGGAFVSCSSPMGYGGLAAGEHTFAVRATDAAGNADETPASATWTIDTAKPDTSITSTPPNPSVGEFVSFGLAGSDDVTAPGVLDFQCRLDDAPWVDCASPKSYAAVASGPHTFSVRAVDGAGNVDPTPASHSWTVDASAPETTIGSGPASTTPSTSASFAFSSELGAVHECSLDGAAYVACSSPTDYSGLAVGEHTFAVRAIDVAGNVDPSPASHAWTIDLPPDTTIDSGPGASTPSASALFRFSSNEPGAGFECALDEASFSSCTSPLEYTNLPAGPHRLQVRATDSAGNVDSTPASYAWVVEAAPETTIVSVEPDMGPDLQTERTSATFWFSADQPGVRFECALDGAVFQTCTSPVDYTGLAQGAHDFEVQAIGAAGNVDPSPATYGWEIGDLTPPVVSITAGPDATTEAADGDVQLQRRRSGRRPPVLARRRPARALRLAQDVCRGRPSGRKRRARRAAHASR